MTEVYLVCTEWETGDSIREFHVDVCATMDKAKEMLYVNYRDDKALIVEHNPDISEEDLFQVNEYTDTSYDLEVDYDNIYEWYSGHIEIKDVME